MMNITNLCFRHLPADFEKQDLLQLCSCYGNIKSAKIMFDLKTGKSKEFGFVCFDSSFSAEIAKEKLNGKWISKKNLNPLDFKSEPYAKKIIVSYAKSDGQKRIVSNEIIVSSLPLLYEKKDIYCLFSLYGEITSIQMIIDKTKNIFHGKAIITYKTKEEAENAFNNLNNIKLLNNSWPLYIQFNNKFNDKQDIVLNHSKKHSDKPKEKESINVYIENKKTNEDYYYKDKELELLMFKLIAEEI